jgi:ubiquinone/menaquinone biosynthesis C-methylase UbiE
MNRSHAGLTTWGLSRIAIQKDFTILDIGCGGGRTIDTLATLASQGKVYGIDYSKASVAVARKTNARSIDQGQVDIQTGSVSKLPFGEDTFDLITAIETHYYWPDIASDTKEILRVLKPGSTLVIIAETYRGRQSDWMYRPAMRLLRATYLTSAEHYQLLADAGFSQVEVVEEKSKGWISVTGRKPVSPGALAPTRDLPEAQPLFRTANSQAAHRPPGPSSAESSPE